MEENRRCYPVNIEKKRTMQNNNLRALHVRKTMY